MSKPYWGKEHDYSLLQEEFTPGKPWFENLTLRVDLGFQGIADRYSINQLYIPFKKKRVKKGDANELTGEQKQHNKNLSKQRIKVEHAIGGMKRYAILQHRNRLKSIPILHLTIGVCAALWNFLLAN